MKISSFILGFVTIACIVVLARSDSKNEADSTILNNVLSQVTGAFAKDMKDVPEPLIHEALERALPKMERQAAKYAKVLSVTGIGKAGAKPNPMLLGFALGLKGWSEYLSKIFKLLVRSKHALKSPTKKRKNVLKVDSRCLHTEDVCYEEAEMTNIHPCCRMNVSCPPSIL